MTTSLLPIITCAILLAVLMLLIYVACTDVKARHISNKAIVALAVLFIPFCLVTNTAPLPHFLTFLIVFAVTFFCFHRNWLGGGDAKLIPTIALWVGPHGVMPFLLLMSLGGVFVAMILMMVHHKRTRGAGGWRTLKLPYGVAIAGAAICVIGVQYFLPAVENMRGA